MTETTIYGLVPATIYEVKVAAVSFVGGGIDNGPYSATLSIQTSESGIGNFVHSIASVCSRCYIYYFVFI